ncbi:MAG: DUF5999 family protein [Streptosporangiaceae bacterium]
MRDRPGHLAKTGRSRTAGATPPHRGRGRGLLCNGVILFDDNGELVPGGSVVTHHRMKRRFP